MCLFKMPKMPPIPRPPMPEDATAAAARERQKRAGAAGFSSTILSSPLGSAAGQVVQKTLLGS